MPSRTHSSVQRTRSLPVHTTPQAAVMFQQSGESTDQDSTYGSTASRTLTLYCLSLNPI